MVSDPRALQYILTGGTFARTPSTQHGAESFFGEGSVISVGGAYFIHFPS
jgi:hypothetical protein